MHPDIPFWLSLVLMLGGLAVLAWSSDVFVDGAAAVAKAIGVSPFVIGMVVIGFGTTRRARVRPRKHHRLESLQHVSRGGDGDRHFSARAGSER